MVYPVTQLISNSFYASGIVGKEFETVSGEQQAEGLQYLNSLLAKKTADKSGIPYFLEYNANFIIGQEQYYIPGLISVDTMCFFINHPPGPIIVNPVPASPIPGPVTPGNQVRYAMRSCDRKLYWATPRANQILSLPYQYTVERQFGGASVYVYFLPIHQYQFQIWGMFALNNVVEGQDLSLTLDQFYIDFLHFELTERICAEYNYTMPEGAANQLYQYRMIIDKREQKLDLTQQQISVLAQTTDGVNYAYANLGTGWTVP
jgi:hypothetical protein